MECNKEDAIKAKEIAIKKMETKDFAGARHFAQKAERLNPSLENISQMITICDVHCAAVNKINGNEDWYGILKVDPTADEAQIKKQYRKLALILHPDKNYFSGAADAFKLIGEAHRVLLDHEKRIMYDSKRRAPPPESPINRPTFWTICPYCQVKYQFYMEVLNKTIRCQACRKSFPGRDMNGHAPVPKPDIGRPTSAQQKKADTPGPKMCPQTTSNGSGKYAGCGDKIPDSIPNENVVKKSVNKEVPANEPKPNVKKNGKRRKSVTESSESRSGINTNFKEEENVEEKHENADVRYPRRSRLSTQNVTGHENLSDSLKDTEVVSPSKKVKCDESSGIQILNASKVTNTKDILDRDSEIPDVATEPETYEYPDPDFSNFDKDRDEDLFAVGQIWAVYDTLGAMPRFYAQISKVISPRFRMKITWLEADPDNGDEIQWASEGLPISCGKFRFGHSEDTNDHPMFSHLVCWKKGSTKNTLEIYPRKGETWALFKDWDIKWYTNKKRSKRKYEYEFIEVLNDYDDCVGVRVAYLIKVKGFACLFCRKEGMGSILVPPKEMFRFSHQVPSCQMTGEEREDVPKGSFELDPASLPTNLEGFAVPTNVNLDNEKPNSSGSCFRSPADMPEPMTMSEEDEEDPNLNSTFTGADKDDPNLNSNCTGADEEVLNLNSNCAGADEEDPNLNSNCTGAQKHTDEADGGVCKSIPEPEFYDFDSDKLPEKFQIGQIWALYSDEDGLPKYYGKIELIEHFPQFMLHVRWLVACSLPKNLIKWHDEEMPISCGKFKPLWGELEKYTDVGPFSHRLRAERTDKKNIFVIFPRKGEVWALYKNWTAKITCDCLVYCEYDIVEVLEENDLAIAALVLEGVEGYKSVFKPQMEGGSNVKIEIARAELLRFSHQLPAFRLTEEQEGSLRGYWELDMAAMRY